MSANSSDYEEDQFEDVSPKHQASLTKQQSPRMMQIVGIEQMRGSGGKGAVSAAQSTGFGKKSNDKQKEASPFQTKTQPINFEQLDNMHISEVAYKSEIPNNNSEHERFANSQLNMAIQTQKSSTANARPANKETPKRDTKPKQQSMQRKQMSNKQNHENEEEMEYVEAKRGSKTSSSMFPDMPTRQTGSAKHTAKVNSIASNQKAPKANQVANIRQQAIKYRSNQTTVHDNKKNSATILVEKPFQNRRPQKMQNFMLKKIASGQSGEDGQMSKNTIPQIQQRQYQEILNGAQTTTNAYSSVHQSALNEDNPHLYIHSSSKPPVAGMKNDHRSSAKKELIIGKPYKVKTKLPYYDAKGTFQSGRVGLKQELNGSPQMPSTHKIRATSHNLSGQLTRDRSGGNPSSMKTKINNQGQHSQQMHGSLISGYSQERQMSAQRQPIGEELECEEQEDSRAGAVAAATKIHNLQQIYAPGQKPFQMESNKSLKSNSAYNSKRKLDHGGSNVKEIHFTQSVAGFSSKPGKISNYINRSPESRRNIVSQQSLELNPKIECAKHSEIIHHLETRVQEMKDEVKIKDNLVNKLLDEEQQLRYALQAHKSEPSENQDRSASPSSTNAKNKDMVNKLKAELNIAYKILSKRDIQLHTLQKNVKAIAFNQCNNERINYLNECLKLQRLLKVYGNPKKNFRGVKVTQVAKTKQPSRIFPIEDLAHSSGENTDGEGEERKILNVISKSSEGENEQVQRLVAENTELREEIEDLKERLANQVVHDKTLELESARNSQHADYERQLSEVQADCDTKIQEIKSILEDTMKDKESLREQHSSMEGKLDEKTRFIDSLERELEASVQKALNLQKLIESKNSNEAETLLKEQLDKLMQENSELRAQNSRLEDQVTELKQNSDQLSQEMSAKERQIDTQAQRIKFLETQVDQMESAKKELEGRVSELGNKNSDLQKKVDEQASMAVELPKDIELEQSPKFKSENGERYQELQAKYNELDSQVQAYNKTIEEQRESLQRARQELQDQVDKAALELDKSKSQKQEIEKLTDEIETLQNNIYTLEQERDELSEQVDLLTKQKTENSAENQKLQDQLSELKSQLESQEEKLLKRKSSDSSELGQQKTTIVKVAQPIKEELEKKASGDDKTQIVDFLMQTNEKLEQKVKDLQAELASTHETHNKALQELQSKLDEVQKERDSMAQKLEEFKDSGNDPTQLKAIIQQKTEKYDFLEFQKQELEDQVDDLQKQIVQVKEKAGIKDEDGNLGSKTSPGKVDNIEDKIIQAQSGLLARLEKQKTKVRDLESKLEETEQDLVLSQEKLHEKESQQSQRESARQDHLNVLSSQESRRNSKSSSRFDTIPAIQAQLKKAKGDKDLKRQELQLLRNFYAVNVNTAQDLKDLQEEVKVVAMERDEFEGRNEDLTEQIEKLKAELISMSKEHIQKTQKLEDEKHKLDDSIQKMETEKQQLQGDLERANKQIKAYRLSFEDLGSKHKAVEAQLKDMLSSQLRDKLRALHIYSEESLIKYFEGYKSEKSEGRKEDMKLILTENLLLSEAVVDELMSEFSNEHVEEKLAKRIFLQTDDVNFTQPSETQLEIGFLTLKQKFEENGLDYRQKIFGLADKEDDDELQQLYIDQSKAKFLTHKDLIESLSTLLNDEQLTSAVSHGCQHLCHSPNLVSFLAFDILYKRYNNEKGAAHTMKELLAKQKSEQEEQLKQLEQQRLEEAERAKQEQLRLEQARKAEADRIAKLEQERKEEVERAIQERERLEQERKAEIERAKQQHEELERKREEEAERAKEERERLEKEKAEAAESARKEKERIEKEKQEELEKARIERERLEKERAEEAERARLEKERVEQERQQEAEKAKQERELMEKKQKLQLELAQKEKEQLEESARKREMELKLIQAQEPSIDAEDLDHDREGFTPEVYMYVKKNNDLSVITNIANASLFSVRNRCPVYTTKLRNLRLQNMQETFVPLYMPRDQNGNAIANLDKGKNEVDVIKNTDFFEQVLMEMGLKRYVDLPEEAEKLEQMLEKIGALATVPIDGKETKVILLDIIISAMRVHKYDYAGNKLVTSIKGVDFRKLDTKSIRIMNRLTRTTLVYQAKYQEQAQEGVKVTVPQIVGAMFKTDIEKKRVARPAVGDGNSSIGTIGAGSSKMSTSLQESDVQVIPQAKFFAALKRLQVRKTDLVHGNLQGFLKMNEQNHDLVLFKKLVKVVEEFLKNHYLKSYGMKKTKLLEEEENKEAEDEYDYEYDDEQEEESKQQQPLSQPQIQQLTLEQAQAQMQAFAEQLAKQQQVMAAAAPKPQAQEAAAEAEGDVEYYYDEEEPPEEEKQGVQQNNGGQGMNAIPENDEEYGYEWQ